MSRPLPASASPKADILRGWIKTTKDAILVFEATRAGIVPRVTRRFHDLEKRSIIQSGAILVFTEEESGIKRWTDPYLWSASRMQGNFLMYREREDEYAPEAASPYQCSAVGGPDGMPDRQVDADLEHYILGSWNKGKGLKKNGLMKKTISMNIEGTTYHLVSYYYPSDVRSGLLQTPSSMPALACLDISPAILKSLSQFRQPPVLGKSKRGRPTRSSRGSAKEARSTGLMLDTRSAPYPSPPRGTTHSQENYFEPFTPSTPRGMVAPQAWSSSLPSSPDSFVHVMPHTSPVSPIDYEFSRHYREDSSSDTSSTASIGSLSRHPSVSDENQLAGAPGVPIRCPRVDIAWHEPPMTSPTSMYGVPIPALHPDLYIASGAVAYEPQPADAHTQELLRSWRPVLDETRLLMGDASGRGNEVCAGERAHSGPQDASLDCYTPPTSYFAGSMYH